MPVRSSRVFLTWLSSLFFFVSRPLLLFFLFIPHPFYLCIFLFSLFVSFSPQIQLKLVYLSVLIASLIASTCTTLIQPSLPTPLLSYEDKLPWLVIHIQFSFIASVILHSVHLFLFSACCDRQFSQPSYPTNPSEPFLPCSPLSAIFFFPFLFFFSSLPLL